jgi:hypothetical protein
MRERERERERENCGCCILRKKRNQKRECKMINPENSRWRENESAFIRDTT